MKLNQNKNIAPCIALHPAELILLIYNLIQRVNLETVWSLATNDSDSKAIPILYFAHFPWSGLNRQNAKGV